MSTPSPVRRVVERYRGIGLLALAISQALWTTAAGLCVAIPAITSYTVYRNLANRTTLRMQAITMDLIKDLRNVEVVAE